ncbi:MAG: hypothetical protein QG654_422 [Patescibacteria group bacterium]|nr:hypothetical protein [Patescibacteria group bacterium]
MKIIQNSNSDELTKSERQSLGILGLTLVLACFYVFGNRTEASFEEVSLKDNEILIAQMTDSRLDDFFESLELKASSVLILNSDTKQKIYGKDTDKVMPLASLVKIMTAVVAMENIDESAIIKIPKEALGLAGDNGLLVDEQWGRDELLRFMLITSSNDATRAISMNIGEKLGSTSEEESVKIFTDLMNAKALSLGLPNTTFLNESGLDLEDGRNGGYSTSKEIVTLFDYAINTYPDIFSSTSFGSKNFTSISMAEHNALNTNQSVGQVAGISASKTGFTNISGGNLIVSFKTLDGQTIIVNVLGSTFTERFTDIEKLSSTTLKIINEVQL